MNKKKILIISENSSRLVDLIYSGLLDKLKDKYDLDFLIKDNNVSKNSKYKNDYQEYLKENFNMLNNLKENKFLEIINKKVNELLFFFIQINHFIKFKRYNSYKTAIIATLSTDKPQYIWIFKILYQFKISYVIYIFTKIIKKIILLLKSNYIKKDYDLLIIAWKIEPISTFSIDVINEAKLKKIKSYGIQLNWDNITDRFSSSIPDYLSIFGEQAFLYLFNFYSISPHRIFVNGSLKIEWQNNKKIINKSDARKNLKLPENKKIICFAPSGENFDEIYILKKLNLLKKQKKITDDFIIYVKGYHGGKTETVDNCLWNEYREKANKDDYNFDNLIFWEPKDLLMSEKDYFINFYSAIDCIISTYSSVCLEAGFHNIPSIGLSYNPKEYGLKIKDNWIFKNFWPHTYSFRNQKTIKNIEISNREEIEDKLVPFLEKVKNNKFENIFKITSNHIISNYEDISVVEKILTSIDLVLNKQNELEKSDEFFHN